MHGYPQFSFWIPIALAKIFFSCIVINCAKIPLYLFPSELDSERRALEESEREKRLLASRVEDLSGRLELAERERREVCFAVSSLFRFVLFLVAFLFYSVLVLTDSIECYNHRVQHNKQHHRKVLHSSFRLNGLTLGFHPQTQKLESSCTA